MTFCTKFCQDNSFHIETILEKVRSWIFQRLNTLLLQEIDSRLVENVGRATQSETTCLYDPSRRVKNVHFRWISVCDFQTDRVGSGGRKEYPRCIIISLVEYLVDPWPLATSRKLPARRSTLVFVLFNIVGQPIGISWLSRISLYSPLSIPTIPSSSSFTTHIFKLQKIERCISLEYNVSTVLPMITYKSK